MGLFLGYHIERKPKFSMGALVEDNLATIKINPIFIDFIWNWATKEQPFAVLVAFRIPLIIGIAFFCMGMTNEEYQEMENKNEQG